MASFTEVSNFIDNNVLHSKQWDSLSMTMRAKAVNNATRVLERVLVDELEDGHVLTVEDIALQTVWILRVDDSVQRAEMGATYLAVDGVMLMLQDKDNTLSPDVARSWGITLTNGIRRKAARYTVTPDSTHRIPLTDSNKLATERPYS